MTKILRRHHERRTLYGPRRRRALLGAVLVFVLAATAFMAARHPPKDKSQMLPAKHLAYASTDGWPLRGQGAYVLGSDRPAVSPHEHPAPIASLAKVMTARLVLKRYPLHAGNSGRRFVVGQRDVADTETMRHAA
jgi:D-alanyl-D-alanine carboxypeptidase (penicillin-binding protein 5/6)